MNINNMKKQSLITLFFILIAITFYILWLVPNYKDCIESGTDNGVCLYTWIIRW